jgi:hypothetical protein
VANRHPPCGTMWQRAVGQDDQFLVVIRYAPILFVVAGVIVVVWLSRQRMPHEWQDEVLAALSETEALPVVEIAQRPPLAHQDLDLETLHRVLDTLCTTGRAVRWYASNDSAHTREAVYRRVASIR